MLRWCLGTVQSERFPEDASPEHLWAIGAFLVGGDLVPQCERREKKNPAGAGFSGARGLAASPGGFVFRGRLDSMDRQVGAFEFFFLRQSQAQCLVEHPVNQPA